MYIGSRPYHEGNLIMEVMKLNGEVDEVDHQSIVSKILNGKTLCSSESAYRRGVSQALNLAVDLVREGCSCDDLNWLCNESLKMRCERKPYPAYLDELMSRFHNKAKDRQ